MIKWPYIAKNINLFKVPYRICILYEDWLYVLEDGPTCGSFSKQLPALFLKKAWGVDCIS
jgi:hypothetical protein